MAKRALGGCGLGCVSTEYIGGKTTHLVCVATDAHGLIHVGGPKDVHVRLSSGRTAQIYVNVHIDHMSGMAFGPDNEMLLVDNESNCIFRAFGGNPTTLVTGDASGDAGFANAVGGEARFDAPSCICFMQSRGLYLVTDSNNSCIRAIARHSWSVTTCCGVPSEPGNADGLGHVATFRDPRGIALLDRDTFVVADYMNNAIRLVHLDPLDQARVSTIPCKVMYPLSVAVDGAGKIVVVCEGTHHVMLLYKAPDSNNYITQTIAGNAKVHGFRDGPCLSALFNHPFCVHIDARGRVLLCEKKSTNLRTPSTTLVRVIECGLTPPPQLQRTHDSARHVAVVRHRADMLERQLFVDVDIILSDGSRLGAHSSILYPHSAFFRTRLSGRRSAPIHVIDLSTFRLNSAQLRILLQYHYTGKLPNMMGTNTDPTVTPLEMCRVADMMLEEKMYTLCLEQMALSLNSTNIAEIATEAYALGLDAPIQEIAAFWIRNPSLVTSVITSMGQQCSLSME